MSDLDADKEARSGMDKAAAPAADAKPATLPVDGSGPVADTAGSGMAPPRPLTSAARRALDEADARRTAASPLDLPPEHGGRDGPEPIRFGDWELKGITSDF